MTTLSNHSAPVVLVTGAAKRLGRSIALYLAARGFDIALHYHQSQSEAEQTARECLAAAHAQGFAQARCTIFCADLSDEAQCHALGAAVIAQMGGWDSVVNSAAIFEADHADSFSHRVMEKHWRTNTAAPIILAHALFAHRQGKAAKAGSACVVNLLDQKLWNQNPDFLSYTLSKAALESATTMLALALKPLVRVVGVAPGLTLTSHSIDDEKFQQLHQLSPLGQSSSADEIAHAVHFVLSNRALTGTSILVDGGQHLLRFERDFSMM